MCIINANSASLNDKELSIQFNLFLLPLWCALFDQNYLPKKGQEETSTTSPTWYCMKSSNNSRVLLGFLDYMIIWLIINDYLIIFKNNYWLLTELLIILQKHLDYLIIFKIYSDYLIIWTPLPGPQHSNTHAKMQLLSLYSLPNHLCNSIVKLYQILYDINSIFHH